MEKIEARYYEKLDSEKVRCHLCPAECKIAPGHHGICMIRTNENGTLYAAEYGNTVALNLDPIEKKPLYHFKPGGQILSIGPNGCNFACAFCQNWTISQEHAGSRYISPDDLVNLAGSNGSIGIAYTYTEPLIWFEYVLDTAKLLKSAGLFTVIVSNGYINEEPARELFRYIDAANIDLKSIRPEFYRKVCKGNITDVQRTIHVALEMGVHVELTNLLIPDYNDTEDEIRELVDWVSYLNPVPVMHFSRYFPNYKLETPPTSPGKLKFAFDTAKVKLKYVYVGNISGVGNPDTVCQKCGAILIKRSDYDVDIVGLKGNKCAHCNENADIVI